MKNKEYLSILGILTLALCVPVYADVAGARIQLSEGNFNQAQTELLGTPDTAEVGLLRALIEMGLWVEGDLADFTKSIGGDESEVDSFFDVSSHASDTYWEYLPVYASDELQLTRYYWVTNPLDAIFKIEGVGEPDFRAPWRSNISQIHLGGDTYSPVSYALTGSSLNNDQAAISFKKNGSFGQVEFLLAQDFNWIAGDGYYSGSIYLNGILVGDISPYSVDLYRGDGAELWIGSYYTEHPSAYRRGFGLWMDDGDILTIIMDVPNGPNYTGNFGVEVYEPESPVTIITAMNGVAYDTWLPVFADGTDTDSFAAMLTRADGNLHELIDSVLDHLEPFQSSDRVVFYPSETGSSESIVVEYADAQVLMGLLKASKALLLLFDMYDNDSIPLSHDEYLKYIDDPLAIWEDYPELLSLVSSRGSNGAQARALFQQSVQHYRNVEEVLWSRVSGITESYLFEIERVTPLDPEGLTEVDRQNFLADLATFEQSLSGYVDHSVLPVEQLSSGSWSLLPFFSLSPVDLRGVEPSQDDYDGIVPNSLIGLLDAGFTYGVDLAAFQQMLINFGLDISFAPNSEELAGTLPGQSVNGTNFSSEARFELDGRFGNWVYTKSSSNAGKLTQTYDEDGNAPNVYREETVFTFLTATRGTYSYSEYRNNIIGYQESGTFDFPWLAGLSAKWYDSAADLGGGWRWFNWFGSFNVSDDPWIFHEQHGWLYIFLGSAGPDGVYFWDGEMGSAVWTSEAFYPSMYRFSDSQWIYYTEGSANPRLFVKLLSGQWEQW